MSFSMERTVAIRFYAENRRRIYKEVEAQAIAGRIVLNNRTR